MNKKENIREYFIKFRVKFLIILSIIIFLNACNLIIFPIVILFNSIFGEILIKELIISYVFIALYLIFAQKIYKLHKEPEIQYMEWYNFLECDLCKKFEFYCYLYVISYLFTFPFCVTLI